MSDFTTPYSEQPIPEHLDFWSRLITNLGKREARNPTPEEVKRFYDGLPSINGEDD